MSMSCHWLLQKDAPKNKTRRTKSTKTALPLAAVRVMLWILMSEWVVEEPATRSSKCLQLGCFSRPQTLWKWNRLSLKVLIHWSLICLKFRYMTMRTCERSGALEMQTANNDWLKLIQKLKGCIVHWCIIFPCNRKLTSWKMQVWPWPRDGQGLLAERMG